MIVAFDASILVYLINADAPPPVDQQTGRPVTFCRERVNHLLKNLQDNNAKIVIPTPALAEILVKSAGGGPDFLKKINSNKNFRVSSFDERAAVEFAETQRMRSPTGKRDVVRAKAKFDDQIVAIATVENAETIYSDDEHITKLAGHRMAVITISQLPLPPAQAEPLLPL